MSSIRPGLTVLKLAVLPGALFMATASAASTPRYTRHSVYTLAILEGLLRMALNLIGESTSCSEYACLLTGEPGMLDCWRVAFSWRKDGLRPFASRPLLEKSERGERLALCDSCAAATGVRGTLTRVRTPVKALLPPLPTKLTLARRPWKLALITLPSTTCGTSMTTLLRSLSTRQPYTSCRHSRIVSSAKPHATSLEKELRCVPLRLASRRTCAWCSQRPISSWLGIGAMEVRTMK
mmetsp:Transcript_11520/g.24691  ORF Transcript_11520/g.24691 Transcript_11520/m.24691 type:complete len:237 (+) Transcript_11520:70-780(+)